MLTRFLALVPAVSLSFFVMLNLPANTSLAAADVGLAGDGIVRVKSAHNFDETIELLKKDIASKGIMFFMGVDQTKRGDKAHIKLPPSTLLIFGNPPLGIQFLTSNPNAGLDWPVRLLVTQDEKGQVWAVYTDFDWIKRRHGITNRDDALRWPLTSSPPSPRASENSSNNVGAHAAASAARAERLIESTATVHWETP